MLRPLYLLRSSCPICIAPHYWGREGNLLRVYFLHANFWEPLLKITGATVVKNGTRVLDDLHLEISEEQHTAIFRAERLREIVLN